MNKFWISLLLIILISLSGCKSHNRVYIEFEIPYEFYITVVSVNGVVYSGELFNKKRTLIFESDRKYNIELWGKDKYGRGKRIKKIIDYITTEDKYQIIKITL